jgi:hypothetical protein
LPRGFVTGVFATSLGLPALFSNKWGWYFVAGLVSALGYVLNPNCVFVALPLLGILFIQNIQNTRFYVAAGAGLLIGGAVWFFINQYYHNNPQLSIHGMGGVQLSFDVWKENISRIDFYFNSVTPFFWQAGWLLLIAQIIPLGYLLYKKQYLLAAFAVMLLVAQIASLSVTKIADGSNSVFFPYSRMYLALPLLLCIVFYTSGIANKSGVAMVICIAALAAFVIKLNHLPQKTNELVYKPKSHLVEVKKVAIYKAECKTIDSVAKLYNAGLVLVQNKGDYVNFGCHCLVKDFRPTLRPSYERRRWRMFEERNKIHSNVLILGYADSVLLKNTELHPEKYKKVNDELYLITGNKKNAIDVAKELNWYVGGL